MTVTAARSSPRTSSFSERQGGAQASPKTVSRWRKLDAGGVQLRPTVPAAAAQVSRDDLQFHRNGFGKASVSQFGCGDDHNAVASETFNLCIEAMANQIGQGFETLAAHGYVRTL